MTLGRMSYSAHLALYPILGGGLFFGASSWQKSSAEKGAKEERDAMPAARSVDPDDFQPFSAIPFHNNPELRYRYANMNLYKYIGRDNHLNAKDYTYKGFTNSYDHDNKYQHLYNWVSMVPSDDAKLEAAHKA